MNEFTIYPAIDLRNGQVVRLRQGELDQKTDYNITPGDAAAEWISQGAEWLHVVNLDGAFGAKTGKNDAALGQIISAARNKAKVQLGGGLRTLDQIQQALQLGVSRVVLGTAVIENPSFAAETLQVFGGNKLAFGLDALGKNLMSRGWQADSGLDVFELASMLLKNGAQTIIYTNILKDGMESGVDWQTTREIADQTGLEVIASGGTSSLEDIRAVQKAGLSGVIIGRALYENNFTLREALDVR
jgi:phosphoribosylformimino-5-aminoimidazole carboxamide ribotide isomerase